MRMRKAERDRRAGTEDWDEKFLRYFVPLIPFLYALLCLVLMCLP